MHHTAKFRTHPPPQAAGTVYFAMDVDDMLAASGSRPDRLIPVSGPQERVPRHTVEQFVDCVPVVPLLDAPVLQMVQQLMEVLKIIDTLTSSRRSKMEQHVDVPVSSFCEYEIVLEGEEDDDEGEEEEELEMFETTNGFEHSSLRPRRLCCQYMAGRCEDGWGCTFGEQELHPSTLRAAERGRASAADHG